jgi:hypothetical protein
VAVSDWKRKTNETGINFEKQAEKTRKERNKNKKKKAGPGGGVDWRGLTWEEREALNMIRRGW